MRGSEALDIFGKHPHVEATARALVLGPLDDLFDVEDGATSAEDVQDPRHMGRREVVRHLADEQLAERVQWTAGKAELHRLVRVEWELRLQLLVEHAARRRTWPHTFPIHLLVRRTGNFYEGRLWMKMLSAMIGRDGAVTPAGRFAVGKTAGMCCAHAAVGQIRVGLGKDVGVVWVVDSDLAYDGRHDGGDRWKR